MLVVFFQYVLFVVFRVPARTEAPLTLPDSMQSLRSISAVAVVNTTPLFVFLNIVLLRAMIVAFASARRPMRLRSKRVLSTCAIEVPDDGRTRRPPRFAAFALLRMIESFTETSEFGAVTSIPWFTKLLIVHFST